MQTQLHTQQTIHGRTYVNNKSGFLISAQPTRSTSRGSVNIQSPDVKVSPLINANSLTTKDDQLMASKSRSHDTTNS